MKHRTFHDRTILHEMLFLRLQGWPLKELAFKYGCAHTSIRKACLQSGIPPEIILLPRPLVTFQHALTDWNGERINRGKNYQDYLKEQSARHTHITTTRVRV